MNIGKYKLNFSFENMWKITNGGIFPIIHSCFWFWKEWYRFLLTKLLFWIICNRKGGRIMKVAVIGAGYLPTTILKESEKGVVVEVEQPRGVSITHDKFIEPTKFTLIDRQDIPPMTKRKGHQRPYKFHP